MPGTPIAVAKVVPLIGAWRVDRTFDYLVPAELNERVAVGSLVRIAFGRRRVRGIVVDLAATSEVADPEPLAGVVLDVPVVPSPLTELARWVATRYVVTQADALERFVPPRVRVKPEVAPLPAGSEGGPVGRYPNGASLLAAIATGGAGTWCFRALPTENRGELIAELVRAAGRSGEGAALVCVPEVRYGSLVLDELERRLPGSARLDSARPDADRARSLIAMASGHGLGAGGRAAVFAPAPLLRVIVIDDEHHPSYKEHRSPRYDARRVAVERARLQGAVCVLMSATPSVETAAAAAAGSFGSVEPERAAEREARPVVEVVDLPSDRAVSRPLHARAREVLRGGGKVALLAPRTGYATALWCAKCKRSIRCPRCETGLAFDLARRRIRCPRCGYSSRPPDVCPSCKAPDLRYVGAGSERLADQIRKSFPRARVFRMDPEALERGDRTPDDVDVYVTTWIGTKPVLRPDVSLVGVLDADSLVRRTDFRAAEHAHEALSEMAAWAGPAADGGRIVIQASDASHHAIQAVARADPNYFLRRELVAREELFYPPYSELIRALARGPGAAEVIAQVLEVCRAHEARPLGPVALGAGAGDDAGALELLVKCADATAVAADLRGILAGSSAGTRLSIDTDPR